MLSAQTGPKIKHVLVISIDGMHSQDLDKWVTANPTSTLAQLAAHGVKFTNAFTTQPSDSIPGTVGIFTGASPALAGMYYDDAWHRAWFKPGSGCTGTAGTPIDLKEGIDALACDPRTLVCTLPLNTVIDPRKLPLDASKRCTPVYPHDMLRVNTVFEVIQQDGGYTAYSEKRPAYDFLNGPSGKGVNDLYTPEIATVTLLDLGQIETFDGYRVQSIVNEINGLNHDGSAPAPVPTLFGMNFQSVNSAKKSDATSGYLDAAGTPDSLLLNALGYVDGAIGSMVSALQSQGLTISTAIIITAKHGESPLANQRTIVLTSKINNILGPNILTKKVTQKSSALIWLDDQAQTASAVDKLKRGTYTTGNLDVYGQPLAVQVLSPLPPGYPFPDPTTDPAPPDIVVKITDSAGNSVNFEKTNPSDTHAEHGGFGERETHVPLLVSFNGWPALTVDKGPDGSTISVSTRQVAPTVLTLLGFDPTQLKAVRVEGTSPLTEVVNLLR